MKVIMGHRGTGTEKPGFPYLATKKGEDPKIIYLVFFSGAVVIQSPDKSLLTGSGPTWHHRQRKLLESEFIPMPCGTQLVVESIPPDKEQVEYLDAVDAIYAREDAAINRAPRTVAATIADAGVPVTATPTQFRGIEWERAGIDNPPPQPVAQPRSLPLGWYWHRGPQQAPVPVPELNPNQYSRIYSLSEALNQAQAAQEATAAPPNEVLIDNDAEVFLDDEDFIDEPDQPDHT